MAKPKIAVYWCASCGGCDEAIVDLEQDILTVVDAVDIVFWPCAMDFKRSDVETMADNEITVTFINGGVRSDEQEEMVHLLRRKSQMIVAFGSCAHLGGVPGLANLYTKQSILDTVFMELPGTHNPEKHYPQMSTVVGKNTLYLPELHESVKPLDQVIDVDYYLPGCSVPHDLLLSAVTAILEGNLPEKGSVLAPDKTLCDTCPRRDTKPEKLQFKSIQRVALTEFSDKCFLADGVICTGPATRSGCGERCINANMPCRGCFGPPKTVQDQGAKFLSAFTSLIDSEDEDEIRAILESVIDPVGLFYMYSLPSSIKRKFLDNMEVSAE
jgi:F420-non-reducing hydrogenase small subunit